MREAIGQAPAKVNLVLKVARPGPDHYHPLLTVFEAINLWEYVEARTQRAPGVSVRTLAYRPSVDGVGAPALDPVATGALAQLPPEQHLAVRAAKVLQPLVAARWGATAAGLSLTVHKTIPAAGGMAGGSADAAATLVAVNDLWDLGLGLEQLEALGRRLGADVPACLRGNWSVGDDRGDRLLTVSPAPAQPTHWWALAFFRVGLSTPAVFRQFDELGLGAEELPSASDYLDRARALTGPAGELGPLLDNELQATALSLRPELAQAGQQALSLGATAWVVSGSGPTVAALCASHEEAVRVAEAWQAEAQWATSDLLGATVVGGAVGAAQTAAELPVWTETARSGSL